jgi:hypothetical protein
VRRFVIMVVDTPPPFDERAHAVSTQPKQPYRELPQIVSARTNRKPSRSTQRVGSLFFQWRQLAFHFSRPRIADRRREHRRGLLKATWASFL